MRFEGSVAASHPSLPGHFPGQPIVPGVVLLAEIERELAARLRVEAVEWPQVKFLSPLRPEQRYTVEIECAREGLVRFRIDHGHTAIASGTLRTQPSQR